MIREKKFLESISIESAVEQLTLNSFNEIVVKNIFFLNISCNSQRFLQHIMVHLYKMLIIFHLNGNKSFFIILKLLNIRMVSLMEWLKDQKALHKKYLWMILLKVKEILKALPTLVDFEIPA